MNFNFVSLFTIVWISPMLAFTSQSLPSARMTADASCLKYNSEDAAEAAEPLPLTIEDLKVLSEMKTRRMTIPIILMEACLPGQKIQFSSSDPKFEEMIKYVLSIESDEIGIIGFNPMSGAPLNRGVTAIVNKEKLTYAINKDNPAERMLATCFEGLRSFEVVGGDPWMDETRSFYLANVEITDNRKEFLSEDMQLRAEELFDKIPLQFDKWAELLVRTEHASRNGVKKLLKDVGSMPVDSLAQRANWVASLVNPTSQGLLEENVCPEIRPAMMACRNDHDRMVLASAAFQSSIDYLSGNQSFEQEE